MNNSTSPSAFVNKGEAGGSRGSQICNSGWFSLYYSSVSSSTVQQELKAACFAPFPNSLHCINTEGRLWQRAFGRTKVTQPHRGIQKERRGWYTIHMPFNHPEAFIKILILSYSPKASARSGHRQLYTHILKDIPLPQSSQSNSDPSEFNDCV